MTFASIFPSASLAGSSSTYGAKSLTSPRSVLSFSSQPWTAETFSLTRWKTSKRASMNFSESQAKFHLQLTAEWHQKYGWKTYQRFPRVLLSLSSCVGATVGRRKRSTCTPENVRCSLWLMSPPHFSDTSGVTAPYFRNGFINISLKNVAIFFFLVQSCSSNMRRVRRAWGKKGVTLM